MQQTLFAKNLRWTPNKPLTNTNIPYFFQSPSDLKCNKVLRLRGGVKCSMDYSNNYSGGNNDYYDRSIPSPQYPRPTEIEWKKELCNSVQLIGIVGTPVQTKQLSSGKVLAWCRLAVKNSATDTTWVNLTFWNDVALVAFQHIEKGNKIFVSGRLISDSVESDDGKQQTFYKVVVQQLNFVERNFSPESSYDDSSSSATPDRKLKNRAVNSTGSIEALWQAYFANPVDWWDNRKNKRSPNYPDFKHKDTGEALWIEGRNNPSWVKSQLSILDTKMETYHNHNSSMRTDFMASDFSPY